MRKLIAMMLFLLLLCGTVFAEDTAEESADFSWDDLAQLLELLQSFGENTEPVQMAPVDYESSVVTAGALEAKYLTHGEFDVSFIEEETEETWEKYLAYYPTELEQSDRIWPVIVMVNGSGVLASNYPAVFQHYASWGFVVIGNEHDSSWQGDSSDASLAWLLNENSNPESVFYQRIDLNAIGIVGHSQGGVGVFNAITVQPHCDLYKCAVALSPTSERVAEAIGWHYDTSKVSSPVLMFAGTEGWFETESVIPLEDMNTMYDRIPVGKAMARRIGAEHGQMLYSADGYVTAWFMWHLRGDEEAALAFIGENPEIAENPLYQDQRISLSK